MKKTPEHILIPDKIQPNIGLSEQTLREVSALLTTLLADEYVLYTKTKYYHWNIKSLLMFNDLHKFFDELAEKSNESVDKLAERIRALGFRSIGSLQEFIECSTLNFDKTSEVPSDVDMIKNLLADNEQICRSLREAIDVLDQKIKDPITSNFLQDLTYHHEKAAWRLRGNLVDV